MSVSGNFTVPDNLPKLFIFYNIWKNIGCKYGAVSENFTIAQISYNYLFFCCFCLVISLSPASMSEFFTVYSVTKTILEGSSLNKLRINCRETTIFRLGSMIEKNFITKVLAAVFFKSACTLFSNQ
jgi:hypothetical protein